MSVENFNIRVYGLVFHSNGDLLITHEDRFGKNMIKFVGGGLEKGEGIADALIREFKEELEIDIEIDKLFYINDFLQISAFTNKDQIISVYYTVKTKDWEKIEQKIKEPTTEQSFEWVSFQRLTEIEFTFPIDKVVVDKLIKDNLH